MITPELHAEMGVSVDPIILSKLDRLASPDRDDINDSIIDPSTGLFDWDACAAASAIAAAESGDAGDDGGLVLLRHCVHAAQRQLVACDEAAVAALYGDAMARAPFGTALLRPLLDEVRADDDAERRSGAFAFAATILEVP